MATNRELVHSVLSILMDSVDLESLDKAKLRKIMKNPKKAEAEFTAFLRSVAPNITNHIKIDRTKPFDPSKFVDNNFNKGGYRSVKQNERSLLLTEIDISKIQLEVVLSIKNDCNDWIWGDKQLKRFNQEGRLLLDGKVYQTFLEN